ncbi:hypothetical protein PLICRDRAFT_40963 [Plicaturopsis crispa FD-325 SS-3]|nr:hypothetical protein PLICRDRAFT_40963 [Plicaturopsis crispa FD-325 SS-3]
MRMLNVSLRLGRARRPRYRHHRRLGSLSSSTRLCKDHLNSSSDLERTAENNLLLIGQPTKAAMTRCHEYSALPPVNLHRIQRLQSCVPLLSRAPIIFPDLTVNIGSAFALMAGTTFGSGNIVATLWCTMWLQAATQTALLATLGVLVKCPCTSSPSSRVSVQISSTTQTSSTVDLIRPMTFYLVVNTFALVPPSCPEDSTLGLRRSGCRASVSYRHRICFGSDRSSSAQRPLAL